MLVIIINIWTTRLQQTRLYTECNFLTRMLYQNSY